MTPGCIRSQLAAKYTIVSVGFGSLLLLKFAIRFDVYKNYCFGGSANLKLLAELNPTGVSGSKSLSNLPVMSVVEIPVVRLINLNRPIDARISFMSSPCAL